MARYSLCAAESLKHEMGDENSRQIRPRYWPQHLAAFLAAQSATCAGAVLGWTSPVLPRLQDNATACDGTPITVEEGSWIASLAPFGALLGAMTAGYLADRFGRKKAILATALPFFVGSLLTVISQSVVMLCSSRFISGLAVGIATTVVPLYSEEIAEPKLRGALGVYLDTMLNVGILWSYIMGFMVPYMWFTTISSSLPFLFFVAFLWMPESPVYLMSTDQREAAENALQWLRGAQKEQTDDYIAELCQLQNTVLKRTGSAVKNRDINISRLTNFFKKFSMSPSTSKACFVIFGLIFFQLAGGIDAVTFYAVSILQDAGTVISPFLAGAIVGTIQLLASVVSFFTVDRLGRRVLLLTSLISMCISHFLLSLNFALKEMHINTKFYSWMPLFAMCVYFITFSLGLGPLPWFMMAELSPSESKETIGSVAMSFSWTLAFIVSKFFSSLFVLIGSIMTYAMFSGVCFLGIIFVAVFVPETNGKTRREIEEYLSKGFKRNRIPTL